MFEDWSGAHVVTTDREMELAKKNVVRFFLKPKLDKKASDEAGEPRYKDEEYIEIITGDRNNIPAKPLRVYPKLKRLYRERYEAWRAGNQDTLNGAPLEHLPGMLPSQTEELRFHHIRTIEQLAEVSDEILQRLGPGYRDLQGRCKKHLAKAKENFASDTLKAELAKKDAQLDALMKRLEALETGSRPAQEAKPKTAAKG